MSVTSWWPIQVVRSRITSMVRSRARRRAPLLRTTPVDRPRTQPRPRSTRWRRWSAERPARSQTCSTFVWLSSQARLPWAIGDRFFAGAQREVDRMTQLDYSRGTIIRPAACGDEGPLIGAGAVGFRGLGMPLAGLTSTIVDRPRLTRTISRWESRDAIRAR